MTVSSPSSELEEQSILEPFRATQPGSTFEAEDPKVHDNDPHDMKGVGDHQPKSGFRDSMIVPASSNNSILAPKLVLRFTRRGSRSTAPSLTNDSGNSKRASRFPSLSWVSLNNWPSTRNVIRYSQPHFYKTSLNAFDIRWSTKFRALNDGHRLNIDYSQVRYLLYKYTGSSGTALFNSTSASRVKRIPWQNTVLWCLQNNRLCALQFIVNTMNNRGYEPPRYSVEDCLNYLSRRYLQDTPRPGGYVIGALRFLTGKLVRGDNAGSIAANSLPHSLLRLLLRHSNGEQVTRLYNLVYKRGTLRPNTMLHFFRKFVDLKWHRMAMRVLARICASDLPLSSDQLQSNCVRLLRAYGNIEKPYVRQVQILTQMLEMGITPKNQMYNVILLNMVEAHDFNAAWQAYMVGKQNSVTNSISCGILLKGAKLSGNASILDLVICEANQDPEMFQDLRLISDILNTIHVFSPEDPYSSMLGFYKQHCDLGPLQELGLLGPETKVPLSTNASGATPSKYILGQMIGAYLFRHRFSDGLIHNYNLYHELVRQNHTVIAPLALEDYVSNAFILVFGKRPETLQYCTMIIRHMLEPASSPGQPRYAAPTVRTWSVLAASYLRHNQRRAAEKVLTMMRERGLEPDKVTWNTMVSGYSGLQDVEGVVGAMRGMKDAGHEVDSRTIAGMGRLWDRDRLLEALKKNLGFDSLEQQAGLPGSESLPVNEADAMAGGLGIRGMDTGQADRDLIAG